MFVPTFIVYSNENHLPLFGELKQTSEDICDSDSDPNKSWDIYQHSSKSGFWISGFFGLSWTNLSAIEDGDASAWVWMSPWCKNQDYQEPGPNTLILRSVVCN